MKADQFFEVGNKKACVIELMPLNEWGYRQESLLQVEVNSLKTMGFNAEVGSVGILLDQDGQIGRVFVGCGDDEFGLGLASAATKLPAGRYVLEKDYSRHDILLWALAQYCFTKYKPNETEPRILMLKQDKDLIRDANAIFLVRDLINTPANDMGPEALAQAIQNLADEYQGQYKEWSGDTLLSDNFPAIHAVGRAAKQSPRLSSFTWGDASHPTVILVGKGVCFDSGGLDIKASSGMRLMKKDMGGAAHVLGLAKWIMMRQLPIQLKVYIPAVENAIGGDAFRPGDVLTMRNKLTVEIDNTDAEGRLVLADALVKASEDKPDLIIDFATLTGAARIAVGTDISAYFCNDDQLSKTLEEHAIETQDPVWRLPLFAGYRSMLKSSIADMANSASRPYAGATTAALFLERFVASGIPWLHFDVMAWNLSTTPGKPEGGEAMGIRAVAAMLDNRYGDIDDERSSHSSS